MSPAALVNVILMAAQLLVQVSFRESVDTVAINVIGTVLLLEAVRCCS